MQYREKKHKSFLAKFFFSRQSSFSNLKLKRKQSTNWRLSCTENYSDELIKNEEKKFCSWGTFEDEKSFFFIISSFSSRNTKITTKNETIIFEL